MRKKYDAIIFDVDGTLWNASLSSARGWNRGLEALGLTERVTAKQIESVSGKPFEQCVDELLPGLRQRHSELTRVLENYEKQSIQDHGGEFYDEAIAGLRRLSGSYRIFLVSNCQDWYLKTFIQYSGIEQYLSDQDCYGLSKKPKHEMIRSIVNRYKLKKAVYIGDTHGDKQAARIARVSFRYAAYGFGNNLSFGTFSDIVKFFQVRKKKKNNKEDKGYEITEYI